ncbi:MAG: TonB-dependent receptor [Colwellia sp.]|nr:TonB-dependent receptor [Colwellia sp.]
MYNNSKVAKAIRLAMMFGAGAAAAISAPTFAAAADEGAEEVEKIQVTGSRIKRNDLEGPSPITVFSEVDMANTGVSTVADFLRTNASTGGFNESATLSQTAGAARVGLKGFASDYTLILLNGRRLPKNSAGTSFTDINQIPMAAVERIEILPDGASAVYGSDAIAGVINIITKKDYDGLSFKAKYGQALEHGDGEEMQFQFVAGASTDKTNILFAADYFSRGTVMAKDRELGQTAYLEGHPGGEGRSTWGIPGATYISAPSATDTGWAPWADCPTENIHSNGRCRYDFAHLYQLQPESDRFSIFTTVNHEVSDKLTLDGQFRYTRAYTLTSNAPAPGAVDISASPYLRDFLINDRYADNPALGAQIADEIAAGLDDPKTFAYVGRRYLDFPNRQKDNTNDTFEAVIGATYMLSDDWELDFDLGHSTLTNRQIGKAGQLIVADVEKAFADGGLNPFILNDCSSDANKELCDGLNSAVHRTSEYEVSFGSLVAAGTLGFELPGGEIGIAAGLDYRREQYLDRSDTASVNGDVIGGAGSNGGGYTKNEAAFVEVNLPVIEGMDVNLAIRHDAADWGVADASDTTFSGKVSYRPIDSLLLRASYGTGFKAPSLDNLYLASSFGVRKAIDTKLCNAANDPTHADCTKLELNSKSGGNTELVSETSTSYNIGAVYEITEDLSFSLDYWSLSIDDIVGSLPIQEILDEEAQGRLTELVIRNSAGRLDDTARNGFVKTDLQNLSESSASGLIYNVQYNADFSFGSIGANFRAEQFLSFESQNSATQPLCDSVADDARRTWNANAGLTWDTDDFASAINFRFLPGFDDYDKRDTANKSCDLIGYYNVTEEDPVGDTQHIDSYLEVDIKTSYSINSSNTVTIGIRNLFDAQPSFSQVDDWPFYSQGTYNNMGRFAYIEYNVEL